MAYTTQAQPIAEKEIMSQAQERRAEEMVEDRQRKVYALEREIKELEQLLQEKKTSVKSLEDEISAIQRSDSY